MLLIIDGNQYLYRAQYDVLSVAYNRIISTINDISPTRCAIVFDHKSTNFRHKIYPDYKANRKPMPIELRRLLKPLRKALRLSGYKVYCIKGYEADDIISTICSNSRESIIIDTPDKDLMQLVSKKVTVYNSIKRIFYNEERTIEIWGVKPNQIIDVLSLAGDKVDNIPGVKNIGIKTAIKLVQEYNSLESIIRSNDKVKQDVDNLMLSKKLLTLDSSVKHPNGLKFKTKIKPKDPSLGTFLKDNNIKQTYKPKGGLF